MKPLLAIAETIRREYQLIVLVSVIVGLGSGLLTTAPGDALQTAANPIMFLMIFSISLSITPRQFIMVIYQPAAVLAGLVFNFLFMPLLCWALARLFVTDSSFYTGILLIGVMPCAGMAAVFTALADGDVPLGLAINALTMVLGPFLIPLEMGLMIQSDLALDSLALFKQLAILLLLPLGLGVGLRWLADRRIDTRPYLPLLPALSGVAATFIRFAVCNRSIPSILERPASILQLTLLVTVIFTIAFLIPNWIGKHFFDEKARIAITFSSGMKNLGIAVGLALTSFPEAVGLPVMLGMIVQILTSSLFYRMILGKSMKT